MNIQMLAHLEQVFLFLLLVCPDNEKKYYCAEVGYSEKPQKYESMSSPLLSFSSRKHLRAKVTPYKM